MDSEKSEEGNKKPETPSKSFTRTGKQKKKPTSEHFPHHRNCNWARTFCVMLSIKKRTCFFKTKYQETMKVGYDVLQKGYESDEERE